MRIIAGRLRGRTLRAPARGARPTTDRTREAIFNMVEARLSLDGARVLDLFAGSGALGLEALSRGAAHATLVEQNPRTAAVIKSNAASLGVSSHVAVVRGDALRFVEQWEGSLFDLIMADPPYDLEGIESLPDLALPCLSAEGLLVCEHSTAQDFGQHPRLETSRDYGSTRVSIFA